MRTWRRSLTHGWLPSPQAKQSYLAAFDTTTSLTDALFFGAFMAMGLYLAALATAILTQGVYRRWIGWVSAVSAGLVLSGDLLVLVSESAFIAVLVGYVLYKAVLIALGVSMWRQGSAPRPRVTEKARSRSPHVLSP